MMHVSLVKTDGNIVCVNVLAHGRENFKQLRKCGFSNCMIDVLLEMKNFRILISFSEISRVTKF